MIEWLQDGRTIASQPGINPAEKAEIEAHILAIELSREAMGTAKDLVRATYDLLALVRKPSSQERKEVEARKGTLLPVEATCLGQFYSENQQYFGWVNESQSLRNYTPPLAFEVAVFPDKLRVPDSNNSPQARQLQMTEDYSKKDIEPVFSGAKAIMLPATALAQLDVEFQKGNNGAKLYKDFWARALDTTVDPLVAFVGRLHPDGPLYVDGWPRDIGDPSIWAFPAVVFVRK